MLKTRAGSATKTAGRPVTFAQNAAIIADQMDAEDSSVFELQRERQTDPVSRIAGGIEIDGAFDAVKAGDRQTGVLDESLMPRDGVMHGAERRPVQNQFSVACEFFNKFHHLRYLPGFLEQLNNLSGGRHNRIVLRAAGVQRISRHFRQGRLKLFFVSTTAVTKARNLEIVIQ